MFIWRYIIVDRVDGHEKNSIIESATQFILVICVYFCKFLFFLLRRERPQPSRGKVKWQSWENFRHILDSNYWQANQVFWQTTQRFRGKNLTLLDPSKTKMLSYSAMRSTSLTDEESISKIFWTQSLPYNPRHRGSLHLVAENTITPAEVFLAVKTLKAASCDEIRLKMLKALNREGVLWLNCVCQVSWCFGRPPKDWQTEMITEPSPETFQ